METNEENIRKVIKEELDKRDEKNYRDEINKLYFKSRFFCMARGINPPVPPPWLNIEWHPEKPPTKLQNFLSMLPPIIAVVVFVVLLALSMLLS